MTTPLRSSALPILLASGLSLALGFLVVTRLEPRRDETLATAVRDQNRQLAALSAHVKQLRATAAPASVAAAPTAGDEALRTAVREECGRAGARADADRETEAPETTPEQDAAFARAKAVLDAAIARGVWNEKSRDDLREPLRDLGPAQREALAAALFPAVNRGAVKVQVRGPLI